MGRSRDSPAGCVNLWDICVTGGAERSDGPERRPLEGARMRHQQRPCRSLFFISLFGAIWARLIISAPRLALPSYPSFTPPVFPGTASPNVTSGVSLSVAATWLAAWSAATLRIVREKLLSICVAPCVCVSMQRPRGGGVAQSSPPEGEEREAAHTCHHRRVTKYRGTHHQG